MPSTFVAPRRRRGRDGRRLERAGTRRCRRRPSTIVSGVIPCSSLYASWIGAAAVRLVERLLDRLRLLVGVHEHLAVDVPRRAADRLDERRPPAQEALLVGVEDRDERHLGQVEPLAQEVDADEHVVLAEPQLADDLDPLERVDLGVEVARLDAGLEQVVGQVLGHLLRQRRDEHALARLLARADLAEQVVDLVLRRPQLDLGIDDARRPDQLLGDDRRVAQLERRPASPRRRRAAAPCARNSSKRSGRLSSADGSRKPKSTSVCLRERSPSYMPPICGTVWCDSSTKTTKSFGK